MAGKSHPHDINRSKRRSRHPSGIFIYERLLLLNLHTRAIGEVIKDLVKEGALLKSEAAYFGSMVEEARASLSQNVVETMDVREIHLSAVALRQRQQLEKKLFPSGD